MMGDFCNIAVGVYTGDYWWDWVGFYAVFGSGWIIEYYQESCWSLRALLFEYLGLHSGGVLCFIAVFCLFIIIAHDVHTGAD